MSKKDFVNLINVECEFLISQYKLEIVHLNCVKTFNNCIAVFTGNDFDLKIIKEREEYAIYFHGRHDHKEDNWYDLDIIRCIIEDLDHYEPNKMLHGSDIYDTNKQLKQAKKHICYLEANMEKVLQIFKKSGFISVRKKMDKFRMQRAKILFG